MFSFQYFWVWQQAGKRGRKSNTECPKVRFQTAEYGFKTHIPQFGKRFF
jgi:hypothetical protein